MDTTKDDKMTLQEFTKAVPSLKKWGVEFKDPKVEFKKIDNNFNNVIKISAKRGGSMSPDLEEEPITLEKVQYAKKASQLMLQKIDIIMQPEFK